MIPRSPILLLAAAQALAQRSAGHAATIRRQAADGPVTDAGAHFVHLAGYWSHHDPTLSVSSWPYSRRWSAADIVRHAQRHKLLGTRGSAGDLVVIHDARGTPRRLGVVLAVLECAGLPRQGLSLRCDVLWGDAARGGTPRIERQQAWFSAEQGDRFIQWYLAPDGRDQSLRWVA